MHTRHVGTWACNHAKHIDMWACKHSKHVGMWAPVMHAGHAI